MEKLRLMDIDGRPLSSTLHQILSIPEEMEKALNAPTRSYVRDAKAMSSTTVDIKDCPTCYVFIIDMPGVKAGDIKVQIEEGNILFVSGEKDKQQQQGEVNGGKYVRMERWVGGFMRRFRLPDNANTDAISAVCKDGVLTITVEKLPPRLSKKTIEVKIG